MQTKRRILSLRADEIALLKAILEDYVNTFRVDGELLTPVQTQAQKILEDTVKKLINKLEIKNGR